MQVCHPWPKSLVLFLSRKDVSWRRRWYQTTKKGGPQRRKEFLREGALYEESSESEFEPISPATQQEFTALEEELQRSADDISEFSIPQEQDQQSLSPPKPTSKSFPDYRIPHRFVGFDPRRMDLQGFPRLRTDFDGNRGELIWMGTECQRCGLQIRRERRTHRETSLNVYASSGIPDDLLRHCPEEKVYPVLWRTRDPYVALDILAIEDY